MLVLLAVSVAVVGAIIVGLQGRWFLGLLVPVAVFSLYVVVRVVAIMVAEIRMGAGPSDFVDEEE